MLREKLKNQRVLIVTHVYGTGPPQDLEEYLKTRAGSLVFIGHPFPYTRDRRSFWRRWKEGQQVAAGHAVSWQGPEIGFYLKDAILTLYWAWRHGGPYDLMIGAGGFNAVGGLFLKLTGRVRRVIFYCIDWVPQRFNNFLFNGLYRLLDRLAVTGADQTWNLSSRMAEVRSSRGITAAGKQMTVPVGVWLSRYPRPSGAHSTSLNVMFLGHLRTGHGLPLIIAAWPAVVAHDASARLHIIGDGPLRKSLEQQATAGEIAESIIWHGFMPNHRHVEAVLVEGNLAIAMYEPNAFTQFTDPGKLKAYLAAGLPIVMTRVGSIAGLIEQRGAGLVIPYEQVALAAAVARLLADRPQREAMGKTARCLAAQFDWEHIFTAALARVLEVPGHAAVATPGNMSDVSVERNAN